jgi:hypothetical protein
MPCSLVKVVSFQEIEPRLAQLNPTLLDALGKIVADSKKRGTPLKLYIARYPYGAAIVDRGQFETPCDDSTCATCTDLKAQCSYSHIPLGVILQKSIEVFVDATSRGHYEVSPDGGGTVPLRVLGEGDLFGVFETLHSLLRENEARPPWSVSSGARSIWIIAPVGDRRITDVFGSRHKSHVDWMRGQSHWRLVQQTMKSEEWHSEVLFIGQGFVERVQAHQPGTDKLFELILTTGWRQSAALRHSSTIEGSLRQRYLDRYGRNNNSDFGDMYLFATACHLLAVSRGDAPAFEPAAAGRQEQGPFVAFEKDLHEVLKTIRKEQPAAPSRNGGNGRAEAHYPVVLQPNHLSADGDRGFYSFRCPSLPGLKLPRVTSYAELPSPVKTTLEDLVTENNNAIDLKQTLYFTQAGHYDINRPDSRFQWQEFLGHVREAQDLYKRQRLYIDSPFLVSGIRVVRGGPARAKP